MANASSLSRRMPPGKWRQQRLYRHAQGQQGNSDITCSGHVEIINGDKYLVLENGQAARKPSSTRI